MSLRSICLLAAVALAFIANCEASSCPGGRSTCPTYERVHTLLPDAELRRYNGGIWVSRDAPPDTFTYTCEYSNFYLGDYFRGLNYEERHFNLTTPLLITLDVWNMRAKREASFFVQGGTTGRVAPPMFPTSLVTEPERWYYVRQMDQTMDFTKIMHATFKLMADLVVERQPFDQNKIHIAMYNYPKGKKPFTGPNEIWIEKPKTSGPPMNGFEDMMPAEELYAIADSWLYMEKEPEKPFIPELAATTLPAQ
ncbi:hypothetical protein BSKO_10710 [Bryopsis sp. KO-2023]|nr:hypothetical protein BSKO_10710 [Bryopsis sp. KO-2023]